MSDTTGEKVAAEVAAALRSGGVMGALAHAKVSATAKLEKIVDGRVVETILIDEHGNRTVQPGAEA